MGKECLYIPESHLQEVIDIIRAGLKTVKVAETTRIGLNYWCDEEEKYLERLREG